MVTFIVMVCHDFVIRAHGSILVLFVNYFILYTGVYECLK